MRKIDRGPAAHHEGERLHEHDDVYGRHHRRAAVQLLELGERIRRKGVGRILAELGFVLVEIEEPRVSGRNWP